MPPVPRKIVLDMDNGLTLPVTDPDDALALALALVSPEVELMGCTCCAGNCRSRQSAENTLKMLALAGRQDIPVAAGREAPLLRERRAHFDYLARKSRGPEARFWAHLTRTAPPALPFASPKAHELIIDLVRAHPGEISFVMLGALTNLALALLAAPEIVPLIKSVVHMGGGFQPTETGDAPLEWITPDIPDSIWREVLRFNTLFDPEASSVVFKSGIPLTLIPVNVTARVFQRPADIDRLEHCATSYHRHLLAHGRPWVAWSMAVRRLPGAHMHDPLTLAALIDPALCRFRTMNLDTAKLLAGDDDWLGGGTGACRAQVAVAVEARKFEQLLARRLTRIPLQPGPPPAE